MSRNVDIFIQTQSAGPARLIDIFGKEGFEQDHIFTPEFNFKKYDPLKPDLLVVMGGIMGVYEADQYPYLNDIIQAIKARAEQDLPTLGICLGAQLIAAALGSDVYKADQEMETGWYPLCLTKDGKGTAVEHLQKSRTNMFHWHRDTFDLPEGCTLLASSDNFKNQIFKYKNKIMAIQSHPEILRSQVPDWSSDLKDEDLKNKIMDDTLESLPDLNYHFRLFMKDWLAEVGLKI